MVSIFNQLGFLSLAFVVPQRSRSSVRLSTFRAWVTAFSVLCCLFKMTNHILLSLDYLVTLITEEGSRLRFLITVRLHFQSYLFHQCIPFCKDVGSYSVVVAALRGGRK